jgi:hypothetical protein
MISIKSTGSIANIIASVRDVPARLVPYAAATALTRCAVIAKTTDIPNAMRASFDRPTPYAINSLFVLAAKKDSLSARIMVKNEAGRGVVPENFLFPEVAGGARREKGFERALRYGGFMQQNERAIPGAGVKLDAYGNVSGPKIRSILSALKAGSDGGTVKKPGTVFAGKVRKTRGVWQRKPKGGLLPLFIFTTKAPAYSPRLDFTGVAEKTARANFQNEFAVAFNALVAKRG